MGKGAHSGAQQAAIAMAKKKKMQGGMAKKNGKKKMQGGMAKKGGKKKNKFPGDVNHDNRITGADFALARKRGMIS